MRLASWTLIAAVGLGLALLGAPPVRSEDAPANAVQKLEEALDAARAATQGDKDVVKALEAALAPLEERAKTSRETAAKGPASATAVWSFGKLWNDALTLLHYHGEEPKLEYILTPIPTFNDGGISLGIPVGGRWSYVYPGKDQHVLSLFQKSPKGETVCQVKVWHYRWDTVYSGVGGENYKKLAKVMHELDRDSMAKHDRKASTRVTAERLNAEFPRSQFYFVEGLDVDEEARLRRRNYYIKDASRTYDIELIEYLDPKEGDDPVTAWLRTVEGPERDAMLASVAPVDKGD